MLDRVGVDCLISSDHLALRAANKLILPGVGHFSYGMDQLRASGLINLLNELVIGERKPILGICLGAQLMGRGSEEGGGSGFGWLAMDTIAFDRSKLSAKDKVPHMGWAETFHTGHPLFAGIDEPARFYYVHSYHFRCDDPGTPIATVRHGYSFPSAVANNHILGVQFHPEKSHAFGRRLLANFASAQFPT